MHCRMKKFTKSLSDRRVLLLPRCLPDGDVDIFSIRSLKPSLISLQEILSEML